MRKEIWICLLLACCVQQACQNQESPGQEEVATDNGDRKLTGQRLLAANCYSCHNPNAPVDAQVAPSFAQIKQAYLSFHPDRATFVAEWMAFMQNPSRERSKMPDAVARFGLMPQMSFEEEHLKLMAAHVYHFDFEARETTTDSGLSEIDSSSQYYLKKGEKLALKTKSVLGKNLLDAINRKGTQHALKFCSERAFSLTDSMGNLLGAQIKRVSDKNRNPANLANSREREYMARVRREIASEAAPQPAVFREESKVFGYYPIITNQMCLQCHGEIGKDIDNNTYKRIRELYPADQATGYTTNQLRGIWVIEMPGEGKR